MTTRVAVCWRAVIAFFVASFLLHLLWENLQAPLYVGFTTSREHFWICLKATATGDMAFMLVIYVVLAAVHRRMFWVTDRLAYRHPATWIVTLLVGALLAVSFEFWAVYVAERWQYAATMPLVPVLGIGLLPVVQMLLVPSLVLLISRISLR